MAAEALCVSNSDLKQRVCRAIVKLNDKERASLLKDYPTIETLTDAAVLASTILETAFEVQQAVVSAHAIKLLDNKKIALEAVRRGFGTWPDRLGASQREEPQPGDEVG